MRSLALGIAMTVATATVDILTDPEPSPEPDPFVAYCNTRRSPPGYKGRFVCDVCSQFAYCRGTILRPGDNASYDDFCDTAPSTCCTLKHQSSCTSPCSDYVDCPPEYHVDAPVDCDRIPTACDSCKPYAHCAFQPCVADTGRRSLTDFADAEGADIIIVDSSDDQRRKLQAPQFCEACSNAPTHCESDCV